MVDTGNDESAWGFAQNLALALNRAAAAGSTEWSATRGAGPRTAILASGTSAMALFVSANNYGYYGRAKISGHYPATTMPYVNHEIKVSMSRELDQIAKDIVRRLLNEVFGTTVKVLEYNRQESRDQAMRRHAADRLAMVWPLRVEKDGDTSFTEPPHQSLRLNHSGQRVMDLNLRDLSVYQAMEIGRVLYGQRGPGRGSVDAATIGR